MINNGEISVCVVVDFMDCKYMFEVERILVVIMVIFVKIISFGIEFCF